MGGCDFSVISKGKTAKEAFNSAREEALYENGHGGYTGTIAEKSGFIMVTVPTGKDPREFAQSLENDRRYNDKFGPALCVKLAEGEYMFFGVASS